MVSLIFCSELRFSLNVLPEKNVSEKEFELGKKTQQEQKLLHKSNSIIFLKNPFEQQLPPIQIKT